MKFGMQVGLSRGHIVFDGDPAPLPKKGTEPPPIFGPCLLWPNGWMDQDATEVGLVAGDIVLDGGQLPLP